MGPSDVRAGEAGAAAVVSGGVVRRPGLFGRLDGAARVVEVSAPAGSGKTVLLRSWIGESGLAGRAGWVAVQRGEGDPQRFWIAVADALRGTAAGSALVRPVTAAPDLDGWAVTEWLLKDLAGLEDRIWLVIDDVHELRSADAPAPAGAADHAGAARSCGSCWPPGMTWAWACTGCGWRGS